MKTLLFFVILLTTHSALAAKLHCPAAGNDDEENRKIARRYFQMGKTYSEKGDHRKSAESYECVLKLVPYSMAARIQFAKALDALAQYTRAREQYELILNDVSGDADAYKPDIRTRLNQIKGLPDKPLPKDEEEEADPAAAAELKKQQERVKQLEFERENEKKELERRLKELEKAGTGNLDAQRKALLDEFKRKEAEKMKEMERRIQRLQELERLAAERFRNAGPPKPRYKEVPTRLRKIGIGLVAGGLILGVATAGAGIYSYLEQGKFTDTTYEDKNQWKDDEVVLWSSSKSKSLYDSINTINGVTIALGVVTGIVLSAGVTLYFVGGSDRVLVSGSVTPEPARTTSWQVMPNIGPDTAGFVLQT
ncbi:MAG: hypothetical protein CVU59_00405, partial [Deltaproteobacteria bacterium HGW-Deltaproteobacteria-17]